MTARWSSWKRNGVPDDDSVVSDRDLLDQQSDHALTLDYVESFGGRAQTGEKPGQRFSETQIGGAVGRLVCDRLQLGAGRVLAPTQLGHAVAQLIERKEVFLVGGEQARNALLQTSEIAAKPIFATLCRIGVACGLQPAVELALDQAGLFEQLDDLGPCDAIEKILADRAAVAKRSAEPAPGIGTETTIVIDRAGARSRRCPVERVAAVGTGHQALHHTGHDRPARCVRFVGFQTLLGEGEGLLIDDRRQWNGDPLVLRPLMVCTVTRDNTAAQAQRSGDSLPRRGLCLAKASGAFIGGVAQHGPDRRAFPATCLLARRDPLLLEQTGDRNDAEAGNGIALV